MSLTAFVATSLAILITPGPTNTLLAASAAAVGLRRAVALPLAEAAGYALAIGFYLVAGRALGEVSLAMAFLKAVASAWLIYAAFRLWQQPFMDELIDARNAFRSVFITTVLNPKAMLVGAIVIPAMMSETRMLGLTLFVALSSLAGLAWIAFGSVLPKVVRPYAYKAAAVALGAFSIGAAASMRLPG